MGMGQENFAFEMVRWHVKIGCLDVLFIYNSFSFNISAYTPQFSVIFGDS